MKGLPCFYVSKKLSPGRYWGGVARLALYFYKAARVVLQAILEDP